VWDKIQDPAAMQRMAEPVASIEPVDPPAFPDEWVDGERYEAAIELLGLVPAGRQTIAPERLEVRKEPGEAFYRFEDAGHGSLFQTWNHVMTVRETSDGRTAYTDDIEVAAGVLTPIAYLVTKLLVAHRHRRWHDVVDREAPRVEAERR